MSSLFRTNGTSHNEISKAATHQFKGYEHLLAIRIALQKLLDEGNKFPQLEDKGDVRNQMHGFKQVSTGIQSCLSIMHNSLKEQAAAAATTTESSSDKKSSSGSGSGSGSGSKRGCSNSSSSNNDNTDEDECDWDSIYATQKQLQSKWESSINLWHSRLHYGSNGEKLQKGFQVFNQSLWEQVDNTLADSNKCVMKTRMLAAISSRMDRPNRTSGAALPEDQVPTDENAVDDDSNSDNGDSGDDENGSSKSKRQKQKHNSIYDLQTYDDRIFYSHLLKAYISSSTSSSHINTQEGLALLRKYKKQKSDVDRRASKGRKLRYTVHKKLQNFMFPHEAPETSIDIDMLLQSLFQ